MVKKYGKTFFASLMIFLMMGLCLFGTSAFAVESKEEEAPVIKVGYVLNYATVKSPIIKGSEGYGYEYLKKLFEYTEGEYQLEFVYCEWEESKEMLKNGELDIIGPTTDTAMGRETYLYPDQSFGDNMIFLSTISENVAYYSNYANINGCNIAVQKNNPNEQLLHDFLAKNNIDATIVYFTDNDYETVFENLDCDLCLSSSLQYFTELAPVATLGVLDFYYVTDIENTELMEEINFAMEELEKDQFLYQEKLYLSYYDYAINSSHYITEEDYNLLQEQGLYYVGMEDLFSPICYKTESGEFAGIAVDVLAMIAESAGISYEIVEINGDTSEEELEQLDFSVVSFANGDRSEATESDVYYQVPFMLIERSMDNNKNIENIGVLNYYGITELKVDNQIYDRNIYEYDTIVEMQMSYNRGEIDSFIVTTSTLNAIRNDFVDLNFISSTMDISLNLTMIFPDEYSPEKIKVFNKLIAQLNKTDMDNIAMYHVTNIVAQSNTIRLMDWVLKNLMLTKVLLGLFIAILVYVEWKRRRNLYRIINVDELTGLATRHAFFAKSAKLIERGAPNQYAIISLDIDNFKYINESFGYKNGSKVLTIIAKNIQNFSASTKLVARADADNFLMLVERKDLMDKIEYSIADGNGLYEELWPYLGRVYRITFSMGVYDVVDKSLDLNFMVDCANIARGLGKGIAHTTLNRFSADMDSLRITNNDIVASMAGAIEKEEFQLYYQPKINLLTEEMVGAEVLVRWLKDGKMVQPLHFIPLFERNGFIEQLDYYVLEKACEFIVNHPQTPKISVNFSGITIMQNDFEARIRGILGEYGVEATQLDIEITETAFVQKIERSLEKIEALRAMGITISMDDFGAGISSLNRLKNIPIDVIKIDREFIVDSLENQRGAEIIKNVIRMAKDLKLEIVAEGIETKEQEEYLRNLGCDVGQGYFFSRPVPEKDFALLLEKKKKK